MHHPLTYLALGDSYTIGEGLPLTQSFPYQTVALLRQAGKAFSAPEVIAKTGWTTDELQESIRQQNFLSKYDFVTLLIGVNNQYRGRDIINYKEEMEKLLEQAIAFAGGKPERVVVVSIPDYSVTPFAKNTDRQKIRQEIDQFNTLNKALAIQYKAGYLDITDSAREAENDGSLLAADGLHPSEKVYKKWAERLAEKITHILKN